MTQTPLRCGFGGRCGRVRHRRAVPPAASAAREVISAVGAVAKLCARVGPTFKAEAEQLSIISPGEDTSLPSSRATSQMPCLPTTKEERKACCPFCSERS